jgi:hypothetical protein
MKLRIEKTPNHYFRYRVVDENYNVHSFHYTRAECHAYIANVEAGLRFDALGRWERVA